MERSMGVLQASLRDRSLTFTRYIGAIVVAVSCDVTALFAYVGQSQAKTYSWSCCPPGYYAGSPRHHNSSLNYRTYYRHRLAQSYRRR